MFNSATAPANPFHAATDVLLMFPPADGQQAGSRSAAVKVERALAHFFSQPATANLAEQPEFTGFLGHN